MTWRAYPEDPVLREFTAIERDGWRVLARSGVEVELLIETARDTWEGRSVGGGRADHPVVELPASGAAVLRRYRRGGLMRHLNRDRYFLGHRAFEELRVTEHARRSGVRVAEPLLAAQRPRRLGYGAIIATRFLETAVGLERWLRGPEGEDRLEILILSGEQIGRMHAAGIAHPDLNLRNVLVARSCSGSTSGVHLIDFDRAVLAAAPVGARRRARDLRRLGRSAQKLGLPLGPGEWRALRSGYGEGWPLPARG